MTNKVALVTGAAKRLGAHTAERLHQQGFNLVLHYNQSVQPAHQLAERLNGIRAGSVCTVQGDLTHKAAIDDVAAQSEACYGRLDVLINNASSFYPTPLTSCSEDQWDDLVGTNMKAPLFLSLALLGPLKERQGCIVNMVDIHGERPLAEHTIYCMAKAGLIMMTKSLARELAPDVRVNGVAPGAILWPESPLAESDKTTIMDSIPMSQLGSPEDIAKAICFLVNDANYITGQIVTVDGGRSLGNAVTA